jgi:hypothetical protein
MRMTMIDGIYHLLSPQQHFAWTPGENVATCPKWDRHDVAAMNCTCGFYAYFNGKNTYFRYNPFDVAAVIEGYGNVTVGTEGFRAEKARIKAMFTPGFREHWNFLQQFEVPIYDTYPHMLRAHPLAALESKHDETKPNQITPMGVYHADGNSQKKKRGRFFG